jgi:uncharacterized protein YecE (DUF72 family)
MNVLIGTSGYQYKEWKGIFYPEDISTNGMLSYYAGVFPTCEINNTFYRNPRESVVRNWAAQVPDTFRFVLKASRRITHIHRLKNATESLTWYLQACSHLEDKRGPSLFQLPPNMKKDTERLAVFTDLLPHGWRSAFEFRHDSWFDDDVYEILHSKNCALCVADTDEKDTPRVVTADWGYLRLRGQDYDQRDLEGWATWVADQEWDDAFVFFKHEAEGSGPGFGKRFMELMGR